MKKIFATTMLVGLIITPLLNLGEVFEFISGGLKDQTTIYTPFYIKILKDIVFIILIFILLFRLLWVKFSYKRFIIFNLTFLILCLPLLFSLTEIGLKQLLAGLRWSMPILLLILLFVNKEVLNENLNKRMTYIIIMIFLFHFLFQVIEFYYGIPWFGLLFDKFTLRNPGIFLLPNTGGFFSIVVLYIILFEDRIMLQSKIKKSIIFLCIISIFLTNSGTSIVIMLIVLLIKFLPKKLLIFSPLILIVVFYSAINFVSIFRGEDYLEISGGTRLSIFRDLFFNSNLISTDYGLYTNTYKLINLDKGIIVDSWYTSILGNLGLFPLIILFLVLFTILIKNYLNLNRKKLALTLIIISFGSTTIINEAYPMNLILVILFAKEFFETKEVSTNEHSLQRT